MAIGGIIGADNSPSNSKLTTFNTSGTLTTSSATSEAEYLVIAGGGGGGGTVGGGGGAGGDVYNVTNVNILQQQINNVNAVQITNE